MVGSSGGEVSMNDDFRFYYHSCKNKNVAEYFILNDLLKLPTDVNPFIMENLATWDNPSILQKYIDNKIILKIGDISDGMDQPRIDSNMLLYFMSKESYNIVEYIIINNIIQSDAIYKLIRSSDSKLCNFSASIRNLLYRHLTFKYDLLIPEIMRYNYQNFDDIFDKLDTLKFTGNTSQICYILANDVYDGGGKFRNFEKIWKKYCSHFKQEDIIFFIGQDIGHLAINSDLGEYLNFINSLRIKYNVSNNY
jgi:hypothetical protein